MHMISRKDLSDAEMDTLTKSCSPTIVITANGEVQTHEEAIVHVKEWQKFLTMKVLDNTPAVLSLGDFFVVSRLIKFVLWIFINFQDTYETGESLFFLIFFLHLQCRFEKGKIHNSDIFPVPVSDLVDDRTGKPEEIQANKKPKAKQKGNHDRMG